MLFDPIKVDLREEFEDIQKGPQESRDEKVIFVVNDPRREREEASSARKPRQRRTSIPSGSRSSKRRDVSYYDSPSGVVVETDSNTRSGSRESTERRRVVHTNRPLEIRIQPEHTSRPHDTSYYGFPPRPHSGSGPTSTPNPLGAALEITLPVASRRYLTFETSRYTGQPPHPIMPAPPGKLTPPSSQPSSRSPSDSSTRSTHSSHAVVPLSRHLPVIIHFAPSLLPSPRHPEAHSVRPSNLHNLKSEFEFESDFESDFESESESESESGSESGSESEFELEYESESNSEANVEGGNNRALVPLRITKATPADLSGENQRKEYDERYRKQDVQAQGKQREAAHVIQSHRSDIMTLQKIMLNRRRRALELKQKEITARAADKEEKIEEGEKPNSVSTNAAALAGLGKHKQQKVPEREEARQKKQEQATLLLGAKLRLVRECEAAEQRERENRAALLHQQKNDFTDSKGQSRPIVSEFSTPERDIPDSSKRNDTHNVHKKEVKRRGISIAGRGECFIRQKGEEKNRSMPTLYTDYIVDSLSVLSREPPNKTKKRPPLLRKVKKSDLRSEAISQYKKDSTVSASDEGEIKAETSQKSSLGSVEGTDDISHCDVSIQTALESAMNVVKSLLLRDLLHYTLSEAPNTVEGSTSSGRSSSDGIIESASTTPSALSLSYPKSNKSVKRVRGGGRDSGDGGGGSSDDDDRPKKKSSSGRFAPRRLKCPFYQRQPEKYTKAACRGEGFVDMAKLKDHLKRVHTQPLRCSRCRMEMNSEDELEEHLNQDEICKKRPEPQDDRIRPQMLKKLDFKKAPFATAKNMEEKWKMMYKVLFAGDPNSSIPSPYDRNTLSPDLAHALAEALEEELTCELTPILEPIVARIKEHIPSIIHRCQVRLAREATLTGEEISNTPCAKPSSVSSRSDSKPVESRDKVKRINPTSSSQCSGSNFEVAPRRGKAVSKEKGNQSRCSTHQGTTSGASTESEEGKIASSRISLDHSIVDADVTPYIDFNTTMGGITLSDTDNSSPFAFPSDYNQIAQATDLTMPHSLAIFATPDGAFRPYHNDPHLYGGSTPPDIQHRRKGPAAKNEQNSNVCIDAQATSWDDDVLDSDFF
ncbi:hypothetical protein N0V90_002351 [Kalmusia sp. IMI 367209]|nr:hypothetical protein N0V90_002351 [Kalmusia sp. IMI 367209]